VAAKDTDGKLVSGEFVFRDRGDGQLELVGDFDGLYRANADPWGQSGEDSRMGAHYQYSRANLVRLISNLPRRPRVLEVGCGLGQVCRQFADSGVVASASGADIGAVAIEKARRLQPDLEFFVADVTAPEFVGTVGRWDVVILNQLLWYVLDHLPTLLDNVHAAVAPNG